MSGKKAGLSIEEKVEILNRHKNGESRSDLAMKFNVSLYTISSLIEDDERYNRVADDSISIKRKRFRDGLCKQVDKAVTVWYNEMRAKNRIMNGQMICKQAEKIARLLHFENFEPNSSWLHRWKVKENVSLHRQGDEQQRDATLGVGGEWSNKILSDFCKGYKPSRIYNAHETGLFYKALPVGALLKKPDNLIAGRSDETRLTLLFICNWEGSDKHVYAIGKPEVEVQTSVPYLQQEKAWMDISLWVEILMDFDAKLRLKNKRILLFVDNTTCHHIPDNVKLKYITLICVPRHSRSIVQPLNQGIISSFKLYYRACLVRKQLLSLEAGNTLKDFRKSINIAEALKIVKKAWWLVTPVTIQNCFKKAFLKIDSVDLEEEEEEFDNIFCIPISDKLLRDYIQCDDGLPCYEISPVAYARAPAQPKANKQTKTEDNDIELDIAAAQIRKPSRREALIAFQTLKCYLEYTNCLPAGFDEIDNALI